jgi:hypothetical protein
MKTIEIASHVGEDGILRLEVPVDVRNQASRERPVSGHGQ